MAELISITAAVLNIHVSFHTVCVCTPLAPLFTYTRIPNYNYRYNDHVKETKKEPEEIM
jgi:hypothetical protein